MAKFHKPAKLVANSNEEKVKADKTLEEGHHGRGVVGRIPPIREKTPTVSLTVKFQAKTWIDVGVVTIVVGLFHGVQRKSEKKSKSFVCFDRQDGFYGGTARLAKNDLLNLIRAISDFVFPISVFGSLSIVTVWLN